MHIEAVFSFLLSLLYLCHCKPRDQSILTKLIIFFFKQHRKSPTLGIQVHNFPPLLIWVAKPAIATEWTLCSHCRSWNWILRLYIHIYMCIYRYMYNVCVCNVCMYLHTFARNTLHFSAFKVTVFP